MRVYRFNKDRFVPRDIGGKYFLVDIRTKSLHESNKIIHLNVSAYNIIVKMFAEDTFTENSILDIVYKDYIDCDRQELKEDLKTLINNLVANKMLESEV